MLLVCVGLGVMSSSLGLLLLPLLDFGHWAQSFLCSMIEMIQSHVSFKEQ